MIEDIEIVIKVKCYRHHQGYCSICKKVIYGKDELIIPNIMIGENSRAIAGYLRYTAGVPYLKVKKIFKDLFNLDISPGRARYSSTVSVPKQIPFFYLSFILLYDHLIKDRPALPCRHKSFLPSDPSNI